MGAGGAGPAQFTGAAKVSFFQREHGPLPEPQALDAEACGALDAARRAMPMQRLVGNGMDYADAVALHGMAERRVPWTEAACWLGDANLLRAEAAQRSGHMLTARTAFFHAASCFRFAQSPLIQDSARKAAIYQRALNAFRQGARLAAPGYDKLEIPHRGGVLHGWLMQPPGVKWPPAVIIFGGADGWREEYHGGALALLERGMAALLLDGPGQGETRILGGMHLHPGVEAAFSAAVGHLLAHPLVGNRVGIWGNSLGGSFAARTAASDARVAACCVTGGSSDPVEVLDRFPRFVERIQAMLGHGDAAQARTALEDLALHTLARADGQGRIGCPLLVLHGAPDPIFAVENAERILAFADNADARMVVWDDGDHCIYNHTHEKHCTVADWFAERLRDPVTGEAT